MDSTLSNGTVQTLEAIHEHSTIPPLHSPTTTIPIISIQTPPLPPPPTTTTEDTSTTTTTTSPTSTTDTTIDTTTIETTPLSNLRFRKSSFSYLDLPPGPLTPDTPSTNSTSLSSPSTPERKKSISRLNSSSKKPPPTTRERINASYKRFKAFLKENPLELTGIVAKPLLQQERILKRGMILLEDFLFIRMKQSGFGLQYDDEEDDEHNKKNAFPNPEYHHSSVVHTPLYSTKEGPEWFEKWHDDHVMGLSDVSRDVHMMGLEFETRYPKLCRNVCGNSMQAFKNELHCKRFISAFGDFIFKNNLVTWGRIIALFCVSTSVAIECCHNDDSRFVKSVMAGHRDVMEKHVVPWVLTQGGWRGIFKLSRSSLNETKGLWWLLLSGVMWSLVIASALLSVF